MVDRDDTTPFRHDDDKEFISVVSDYLEQGAHRLRGLSAREYVDKCRALWRSCETDEVFKVKILMDRLIWDKRKDELAPPPGFEEVQRPEEPPEDLYCVAVGLMFPDGSFVDAPEGYNPTPANPHSRRAVALALPTEIPVDETAEPEPAPYILALFDVLGFAKHLETLGLARIHDLYKSLIGIALKPYVAENQWTRVIVRLSGNLYAPGIFWLPIRYTYFSDSILLWVPYKPEFLQPFLDRVLNMFCAALRLGLPLRGAVAVGTAILHRKSNTFLGDPLVEAARLHDAQVWIGAACGVSFCSKGMRFAPYQVMLYEAPVKESKHAKLLSGLVLDWPRRWRELNGVSASEAVSRLRSSGFEVYYDTTLEFVRFSDENSEWFTKGQPVSCLPWSRAVIWSGHDKRLWREVRKR